MNLKKRILATGYGRAIIKVDRGFFTIKDKPKLHNFFYESHENYEDKVVINLKAKEEKIKLVLTEKEGMIHISLEDV